MSSDEKVLDFPRVEVTSEESARRVMVEARRLASLAPGEWRLWIDRSAERLRIPRAILEDVIAAIIKNSEKKARDAETEARRHELAVRRAQERKQREQKREQERIDKRAEHKRKEREKAFESLISLPSEQQQTRLGELAKRLDEDVAIIRDHFTAFVGMQSWTASTDSWNVELWPDPVETQKLLQAAIIKNSEKKARDAETEARRHELAVRREQERKQREQKREQERTDKRAEHKRKEREKAFESLTSLPREQQETRLGELAKRLDEDVAIIRDHFTAFVGMQSWTASTDSWNVELWPDPVETQKLLQKISAKVRKYIVLRPEALIATALWTMTAWAHEGATHSPILAAISVEPDSGKSTLLGVLRFLV